MVMFWGLWFAGCDKEPADDEVDASDADTDAYTDSDTDADSDADTDTDTDADTDTDTATTPTTPTTPTGTADTGTAACSGMPSDLVAYIEARDASGACVVCTGSIDLAAGLANPCPADVTVTVNAMCLVNPWSILYPNGLGAILNNGCGAGVAQVVVPAGGVVEEVTVFGPLDVGNYTAQAEITTPNPIVVGTMFQVQ